MSLDVCDRYKEGRHFFSLGAQMIVSTERRYSESNISLYMADKSIVHQNHLAKFDVCHIISYPS